MATDKDTNVPNKTDYISREAALETINDILSPYGPNGDAISKTVAYCEIKNIPAADVRPVVKGRWEVYGLEQHRSCICSVCKANF